MERGWEWVGGREGGGKRVGGREVGELGRGRVGGKVGKEEEGC